MQNKYDITIELSGMTSPLLLIKLFYNKLQEVESDTTEIYRIITRLAEIGTATAIVEEMQKYFTLLNYGVVLPASTESLLLDASETIAFSTKEE